ncbi:LysR family transcriptional regulator [Scleromatobacter humisilvae]|uniref:LysR family transcriptional regulator n=1 Tax=Scleromatobacter humisilvae TaxID=2897159 RepID=A0A9X2C211_9BURK|nr:LysR family transcriptional regulator [Scleromatobacter humisilvae]MCK9689433.1 LysR family transcriptional regulator [Scleromatobacter humisilvae]
MDRIDAMKLFVAALNEGSLAGAGRKLGKSPAAVTRAIAFLEAHVGVELLHRTTRSLKLSEAGERYAVACRRILVDLEEARMGAASERSAPRGTLTVTAPVAAGEDLVRPLLDAFMDKYPAVSVRLHLLDRPANLIDEGIDIALRLAHLADSTLVAIRVGEVRRVVVAAPQYLAQHPKIAKPSDLTLHQVIAMTHFGLDSWTFPPLAGTAMPRSVSLAPRLIVNSIRAAVASTVEGRGVTRLFSYHVAHEVASGQLEILLAGDEYPALPVHLVAPHGRLSVPKVRAFVDFAVPLLRPAFAQLCGQASP